MLILNSQSTVVLHCLTNILVRILLSVHCAIDCCCSFLRGSFPCFVCNAFSSVYACNLHISYLKLFSFVVSFVFDFVVTFSAHQWVNVSRRVNNEQQPKYRLIFTFHLGANEIRLKTKQQQQQKNSLHKNENERQLQKKHEIHKKVYTQNGQQGANKKVHIQRGERAKHGNKKRTTAKTKHIM